MTTTLNIEGPTGENIVLVTYQRYNIITKHATKQRLYKFLQLRRHLFKFGDEIDEEFRHVFLFARIQWLVVHLIHFAEAARVVRFTFAFLLENVEYIVMLGT